MVLSVSDTGNLIPIVAGRGCGLRKRKTELYLCKSSKVFMHYEIIVLFCRNTIKI